MEKKLYMPKLRPEMKEGILCAWLKEEGEAFAAGDPLYEMETEKVVNQIEATEPGVATVEVQGEHDGKKTTMAESPL